VPQPIQPAPVAAPPDTQAPVPAADTIPKTEERTPPQAETIIEKPDEKPVEKPKETPPPPPIERKTAPIVTMSGGGVSINSQISAYLAMRNSLPSEKKYSLLTVEGSSFTSEISASSQEVITQYNEKLRSQLPGSLPKVQHGLSFDSSVEKRAIVSGRYSTGAPETRQNIEEKSPDDVARRMGAVAQRNGFKLIDKKIGAPYSADGITRTPLLLKFTGSETQTPAFLAAFKRETLNIELEKITGVPRWDAGNTLIQLALKLLVVSGK
jgi:hypothetical protein